MYATLSAPSTTIPYPVGATANTWRNALFGTLVRLDSRVQPIADLAESWSLSDDRRTLTLNLRPDVRFHSGRKFTADEAKWSIEFAQDPKNSAQAGSELRGMQTKVVGANTLELQFADVMPHIFSLLADVQIMDPESDLTSHGSGTGPFKLDGLNPGVEMRLVRNTQYWRSDRPYLDAVTIRTVPDASSGLIALESGAVGIAQCPENEVQRLKQGSQTAVTVLPGDGNWDLLINVSNPLFADPRVRHAIDLAIDRKRFVDSVLYGLGEPTFNMWPRRSPAWDASLDVGEFNLDRSRQLLSEAGYPNGFETTILGSSAYPQMNKFAQILQSDLAKSGIRAKTTILESAVASTTAQQGKFSDLFALVYTFASSDPALLFTAPPFRPVGNESHFESATYASLVDAARREPVWDNRLRLYRQLAALVKEEAFLLPIANQSTGWAHRLNVHGLTKAPLVSNPLLDEIWLD